MKTKSWQVLVEEIQRVREINAALDLRGVKMRHTEQEICNFVAIDEDWHDDPRVRFKIRRVGFTGHDAASDKLIAAQTFDHPANVRARKVAQLRQELDRPVPHPPEGRSERALPSRNGAR